MQTDSPSQAYRSPWMTEELEILRGAVRKFVQSELAPYEPTWQKQGYVVNYHRYGANRLSP